MAVMETNMQYSNPAIENFTRYKIEPLLFEKYYDPDKSRLWLEKHFPKAIPISVMYILVIFSLQRFMKNRKPFKLKGFLIIWNLFLTLVNLICFVRVIPETIHRFFHDGMHHVICISSNLGSEAPVTDLYAVVFTYSKLIEFGDTVFITLRKQPLIFLHYYHHVITLIFTWLGYISMNSNGRLFGLINTFIHVLMYSYYMLRAASFRLPKSVSKLITTLQITQMFVGMVIHIYIFKARVLNDLPCQVTWVQYSYSMLMYASYLFLFCKFFYQAYVKRSTNKKLNIKSKSN